MGRANRNEKNVTKKLNKRRICTIGLVIVFGTELILRNVFLPEKATDIHIGIAIIVEWLIFLLLIALWIPKVEGKKLGSVGLGKFRLRYLWLGILVCILVALAFMISGFVLEFIGLKPIRSLQTKLKGYSFFTLFGLFLTGTFLEEIFYRGFLIERLIWLIGRRWLAAIVAWFVFTFVHLKFFGLGPTIDVSLLSAALVLLYLKEKSIWPCMIVHGINNALGFLIFPLLGG